MTHAAAAILGTILAAASVYGLCRHLSCARGPASFAAAAWASSPALLAASDGPLLAGCVASCLVPFALAGAFSRERRRWPFLAAALVCALARWRGDGERLAGTAALEALVVAVLAGLGAQRLWDGEGGAAFSIGAAAAAGIGLLGGDLGLPLRLVEVLPAAGALALVAATSRETRARAGVAGLVALFAFQRALEIAIGTRSARASVATAAKVPSPRP